jgi:hypothetical protein
MTIGGIFTRRVRGIRVINLWGGGLLLVLVIGLYLLKSLGGGERADIAHAEDQIADEETRIRLLNAEVAYLEQPARIERLSEDYLKLQPMSGAHEAPVTSLQDIAQRHGPADAALAKAADAPSVVGGAR